MAARGDVAKKDKEKKSSPDWDQPTIRVRSSVLPRVGFVCEAGSSLWPPPLSHRYEKGPGPNAQPGFLPKPAPSLIMPESILETQIAIAKNMTGNFREGNLDPTPETRP